MSKIRLGKRGAEAYKRTCYESVVPNYVEKKTEYICAALAAGLPKTANFNRKADQAGAHSGAAWRHSCGGRFAVPR